MIGEWCVTLRRRTDCGVENMSAERNCVDLANVVEIGDVSEDITLLSG